VPSYRYRHHLGTPPRFQHHAEHTSCNRRTYCSVIGPPPPGARGCWKCCGQRDWSSSLVSVVQSGLVQHSLLRDLPCQPIYSTSAPPSNSLDHDLATVGTEVLTITSYSCFLRDIAVIMPQLQDGLVSCNTPYTRYEKVLQWDARLRGLATRERPLFMTNVPLDPRWPRWVSWARRTLAITSSHKIIMIHRSFLLDSFTNPTFAFTRRTCLAAFKTIIKEYKCVIEEDGPIHWVHQAFAVAASITLLLDVLHRDPPSGNIRNTARWLKRWSRCYDHAGIA
jgi:hypothetical protein